MPASTLNALLDGAISKPGGSLVAYDIDEIRDRLTVAAALESVGIMIDEDARRIECPFCGGGSEREVSLSIFADGRRYLCHRGSCGASGDALAILRYVYEGEPWRLILARAASLVDVEAGPVDPAALAERKRAREERDQARAAARALKASTASKVATERYFSLLDAPNKTVQVGLAKLHEWLAHRGLGELIAAYTATGSVPYWHWVDRRLMWSASVDEQGQLVLPILADDDNASPGNSLQSALGSTVIGMATRCYERTLEYEHDFPINGPMVAWNDEPRGIKTLTLAGSSTAGVFGSPHWIGRDSLRTVVAVGMTDHLAAHIAYPDGAWAIVSANGDGRIDVAMRVACRRLMLAHKRGRHGEAPPEIVLVTDSDDSGRAARERALAVAREYEGVNVRDHDVDGHHDLCDQIAARATARKVL